MTINSKIHTNLIGSFSDQNGQKDFLFFALSTKQES